MKNLLESVAKVTNFGCGSTSSSRRKCLTQPKLEWGPWKRRMSVRAGSFPTHARVVICGSGLVGNSVGYHLIKHGIKDIVMLRLPGHNQSSAGTVAAQMGRPISRLKSFQEEEVIRESVAFYKSLQEEGHDIGLSKNGGLYLAQTETSFEKIKRRANNLPWSSNLQVEVLTPTDIKNRFPWVYTDDIIGGAFVPDDTVAIPARVVDVVNKIVEDEGAIMVSDCKFQKVLVEDGKVVGAQTEHGTIKCDYFVNCAGWFAWEYGQKQEPPVRIPAHPVARQYLKTKPIEDDVPFPTVTDYDSNVFLTKLIDNSMLVGTFEKKARPIFTDGVPSNWLEEMTPDWDHFAPALDSAIRRVPKLKSCRTDKFVCEADSFSPDCFWIIGEAPEIKNYFVGAATNGNALQVAGGMGSFLAHWIAKGQRHAPLLDFDILRFVDVHNCRKFLRDRVTETVGKQYEPMISYSMHYKTARTIRCSPLHATLNERGAVNGEVMGYERALYFDPKTPNLKGDIMPPLSYHKPVYLDHVKREYDACLEGVAVADMSSYAKFHIWSPKRQVVDFLQKLCSNNIDIPVGTLTPTGMHNEHGGYETDCILGRAAENKYFLLTPTVLQTRTPTWMSKFMPHDNTVFLKDVSSMFSCIQLIGPKACSVISELAHCDMTMKTFRFKEVTLACAPKVQVVTYTNTLEPGYSLLIPTEFALHVYGEILKVGRDYGIRDVGLYAHRTLRMEKNLCFWGDEIHMYSTPAEVGRVGRIDMSKDFIGKEAIMKQIKEGVKKRVTFFKLSQDDDEFSVERDQWPWGGEPIFRNGVYIGQVTSAMYGFTSEAMIVYAFVTKPNRETGELDYVTKDYILDRDALYHIDLGGKRVKIYPHLRLRPAEHPHPQEKPSAINATRRSM